MMPARATPSPTWIAPAITTATRKRSNEPSSASAAMTIAVRPAAGPLTISCEPLRTDTTSPPTMPVIRPESIGAPEASAIPRQSGRATRKTTIPAGRSWRQVAPKLSSSCGGAASFGLAGEVGSGRSVGGPAGVPPCGALGALDGAVIGCCVAVECR